VSDRVQITVPQIEKINKETVEFPNEAVSKVKQEIEVSAKAPEKVKNGTPINNSSIPENPKKV